MKALEITCVSACPNRCVYCPQDILSKAYTANKVMKFGDFKDCIDKLAPKVDIHFSGFGENFLHPDIGKMINYCFNKGHKVWVFTTLRGATIEKLKEIEGLKFDSFLIHLMNEKEQKVVLDENYYKVLTYFLEHDFGNKVFRGTGNTPIKTIELIKSYTFTISPLKLISRGGLLKNYFKKTNRREVWCLREQQPVILPNGDIYSCNNDYGLKNLYGNLLNEKVSSIEHSRAEFIESIHKGKVQSCSDCEFAYPYFLGYKQFFWVRKGISLFLVKLKQISYFICGFKQK